MLKFAVIHPNIPDEPRAGAEIMQHGGAAVGDAVWTTMQPHCIGQ